MSGGPVDPARLADARADGEMEYRTLSGLALASCVIGVLCAVLLALGGLVAITRSAPLFLPANYMVLGVVPLAGIVLGLLAGVRIRNSDGILTGSGLARTGVVLSLMTIIIYGAYHGGITLAQRMRTDAFVRKWLELVASNDEAKVTEAFIYTVSPGSRPNLDQDKNSLRAMIEVDHNGSSDMTGSGPYTTFLISTFVRLVRNGGKDCSFSLIENGPPEIVDNGFQMVMLYRVKAPLAAFDLQVQVHAAGSNIPDIRKWHVKGARIRALDGSQKPDWTDLGKQFVLRNEFAKKVFQEFAGDIGPRRDFVAAFQRTTEGSSKPANGSPEAAEWLKKLDSYFHMESPKTPAPPARVVRIDPLDFWSNPDLKPPFIEAVDLSFSPKTKGPPNPTWLVLAKDSTPMVVELGDQIEVRIDCKIMLVPTFLGQCVAIVRAPKDKSDQPGSWKLVGIDVHSARPLPVPPEMRNAPPELLDRTLRGN